MIQDEKTLVRIFIGHDHKEEIAYSVLASALASKSTRPLSISPVCLDHLPELNRPRDPKQSNDFAFSTQSGKSLSL